VKHFINLRTSLSSSLLLVLLAVPAGCGRPAPGDDEAVERVRSALTATTVKINSGGPAVGAFGADASFSGGATLTRTNTIDMTGVPAGLPMSLYQSQRFNNHSYTFSGFDAGSSNEIRLHFADTKWTTINQRTFHIYVNDVKLVSDFDIIKAAGAPNKAVIKTLTAPASASGTYVIKFVGTRDAAMVCGIEIGSSTTPAWMLPLCFSRQAAVSDVQGDVRDIWSGRETAATGKRVGTRPVVKLRFNRGVEPTWLGKAITLKGQVVRNASGTLTDCRASAANGGVDVVPLAISAPAATWATGTLGGSTQRYLADVQVFVSGNVTGSPKVAGALVAGGNVTINGFTLNSDAKPYGVVAKGNLSLTSGTATGAASYGGTLTTSSATVTGGSAKGTLIDFASLAPRVLDASAAVAQSTPNGGLTFGADKIARFVGVKTDSNVFTVDAAVLSQSKGVTISAPATSAVLVNVTGSSVSMSNLSVTLTNVTANKLVWNAPDATTVSMSTVTFLGSLVAPKAAVTLTGGGFTGQLVAASLGGTGTLKTAAFVGWEAFGLTTADVTLSTTRPLLRACSYSLEISGPLGSDQACLGTAFSVPFTVDSFDSSTVSRDNEATRWNAARTQLLSFKPRAGVNTPASEVLTRYAAPLGIGPLETFAAAGSWKTAQASRTTALYQQQHLGVPVEGGSFMIDQEVVNGQPLARWVRGAAVPVATNVVAPTVTSGTAQSTALTAVGAKTPYPWTLSGTKFKAPTTTLLFARKGATRTLAWRVDLSKSGIRSVAGVDVDAQTGAVLNTTGKQNFAVCGVTAPTTVADATGTVDFTGLGTLPFEDMRLTNGASEARLLRPYATLAGAQPGTAYAPSMESFVGPMTLDAQGGLDATKLQPVCNATDAWSAADVVDPARALTFVEATRKFVDASMFPFNGGTWSGFTGNDAANATQLRVISSSHASWGDCPTPGTSCSDAVKTPTGPYSGFVSAWRVDPYVYVNTAFPDPVAGNIDWVQPVPVSHELGHVIVNSSREALGLPMIEPQSEADALNEGFADILALGFSKSVTPAVFSWELFQGKRNAANPKANNNPDTYGEGATNFCGKNDQSVACNPHIDATIFDHWFYLVINGGSGSNDFECSYEVTPPDGTEAERFKQALDLAFYAMTTGAGSSPTFAQIAEATNERASNLMNDKLLQASQAAWVAVGVGKEAAPNDVSPADGAQDVSVWPAKLSWTTTDTKDWEIQIASDIAFTAVKQTADATVLSTSGNVRTLGLTATLDAAIPTYYWRVRQKSMKPWGKCLSVFTFATGDASKIEIVQPETKDAAGVYQANPRGDFTWKVLPDVQTYFVKGFASPPAACPDINDQTATRLGVAPPGSETVFEYVTGLDATQWGITYDNTSTFYLTIAAMAPDAMSLAPCLIVPFKLSQLEAPKLLYPNTDDVVQLHSPDDFVAFTPCAGAVEYRVDMGRVKAGVLEDTYSETKKASDLQQKMNGSQPFIQFPVKADALAGNTDVQYYWTVWAIDANGFAFHNFSPFVFSNAYHIGPAAPAISSPMTGAAGVSKTSVSVSWSSEGAGMGTKYEISLSSWDKKLPGNTKLTFIKKKVVDHAGAVGAAQSTTVTDLGALADDTSYQVKITVIPTTAITAFTDVTPRLSVTTDFTTGAAKPIPAPVLLWDAICSPAIPGLGQSLSMEDATVFAIGDVPDIDGVEAEFYDATDPAHVKDGALAATGKMTCFTVEKSTDLDMCGPSVIDARNCFVIDGGITRVWSQAEEDAANQRARQLWGGFTFQTFRIRYGNSSQNVKGAWSRMGIMVGCIDQSLCTWNRNAADVGPSKAPDLAGAFGIENKCDDSKYAQWLQSATDECIPWQ
jgi:choice-of-anchor A domain-containing protein